MRKVLVCTLFPACSPDELVGVRKAYKAVAAAVGEAMRDAID
jgi:hypothetical protein